MINQQINKVLEKKLNDAILKNKKLEEEITKLKKLNIQLTNNKDKNNNELNTLRIENQKLKTDNENLKKALANANQVNQLNHLNIQNNQVNLNEINKLRNELILKENEINKIKQELISKNNEINELKLKSKEKEKKFGLDEIVVIKFVSTNQVINYHTVVCTKDDLFANVEEKVYQTFADFRKTNNTCQANGNTILKFKTIGENNLQNGTVVQILK